MLIHVHVIVSFVVKSKRHILGILGHTRYKIQDDFIVFSCIQLYTYKTHSVTTGTEGTLS